MLARPGEPFDPDDFLSEIKWDGTRALAYATTDGFLLKNRRRTDITERYPELGEKLKLRLTALNSGDDP